MRMSNKIYINMMGDFTICAENVHHENLMEKSRKGIVLVQYLIMRRGQSVPTYMLMDTLWPESESRNPENALKTLISRVRSLLNQISPLLGRCIVADHGAYRWETTADIDVDLYEVEELLSRLNRTDLREEESIRLYERLLHIYKGDLLQRAEQPDWAQARATALHNGYIAAVYSYVELLKRREDYAAVTVVCRTALDVDNFDDRLHMELMGALIKTERNNEAMVQYKHVMSLYNSYLGIRPSDDIQEFYKQIVNCGKTLEFNLESIRQELSESSEQRGAFVCEYVVFKEIYNLQIRNLERLGSTMFLGLIMISKLDGQPLEVMKQDTLVQGLMDILRHNLRKGDTVTHFTPTMIALLLPTVNYQTGRVVMERVKKMFYQKYPNSCVAFNYRIGPLSSDMAADEGALVYEDLANGEN